MLAENRGKSNDRSNNSVNHQITQLRRLLHCIETTNSDADVHILHLSMRIDFAQQLFQQIREKLLLGNGEDNAVVELINDLQNSIQHACTMTYLELLRRRSLGEENKTDAKNNQLQSGSSIIHDIFFSNRNDTTTKLHPNGRDEMDDDGAIIDLKEAHDSKHKESSSYESEVLVEPSSVNRIVPERKPYTSDEEVSTSKETAIEEEIAEMAHQLKLSTLSVNETLRVQTNDLSSIEHLVSQNLESVTNVTDKVTEQVHRRRWSKQVGTWAMFLSILASFCVTFMIVRVVPKRPRRRGRETTQHNDYRSSYWKHQRDDVSYDRQSRSTLVEEEEDDVTMECNVTNIHHYSNSGGSLSSETVETEDPDDLLWELIWEKKLEKIAANTASAEASEPLLEITKVNNRNDKEEHQGEDVNDANCDASNDSLQEVVVDNISSYHENYDVNDDESDELLKDESVEDEEEIASLGAMLRYAAAASDGDVSGIIDRCIELDLINAVDENGWTALHEAVRRGDATVVETLIKAGADVDMPTNFGEGHTPLQLAQMTHGDDHTVADILRQRKELGSGDA